jgi:hypothetical protein
MPMELIKAGQIGLVEWILIVIGILWLAGILRNTIYVPVVVKEQKTEEKEDETKISDDIKISKPKNKGDDDYTPFEEIKE